MVTKESINRQKSAFDEIQRKIQQNPNFIPDLLNAIQTNDKKAVLTISGKTKFSINSAKGYLRLYNAYISHQLSNSSKQTKSSTKTKAIKFNFNMLHPFSSVLSHQLLSFKLSNYFPIKNSKYNINKINNFANQILSIIKLYNKNHTTHPIRFVRMSIKYRTTDLSKKFYSTKKVDITQIEIEIRKMISALTLVQLNYWNVISPTNADFINELNNQTFVIYEFENLSITYFL